MPEKTIAEKLMIKPQRSVRFVNSPQDVAALIGSLPGGATLLDNAAEAADITHADVIVLFAHNRTELETLLPGVRAALAPGGIIWVAYHKGTSKVKTDINRDTINAYGKTVGMEGVAMISINDDWSALRLKVVS